MTGTSLQRVKAIYLDISELAPHDQPRALEHACEGDASLRDQVARMLAADRHASAFLVEPATMTGEDLLPAALNAAGLQTPERVGPYRIIELIGEGGFGSVYRAEQAEPIRREVALKIVKPGMGTRGVIARFETERQTLAVLDHPGIARVYDAGATEWGQPYFVMELIRGVPVTDYCDRERLPIPERLSLFVEICRAVQHAHQKGVIHRDLKPSNVMVQTTGDRPGVKVIDFGIAKAIDEPGAGATLLTSAGQMVGTPDAMSPEQADPSLGDVDTRADIYALGALLYELLTGVTPLGLGASRRSSLAEITRLICQQEPARPSARVAAMGADAPERAAARSVDERRLAALLRGDLDWIVMKALEKDRARRYETVQELAADVTRHLRNEPVEAGAPSAAYRARKFARRHRVGVAAAAVVALSVGAAIAGISVALSRALDAEADSRLAREESEAVNSFLVDDILGSANTERRGPGVTVVEAMGEALGSVDSRFGDRPTVAARVRAVIGTNYYALGMLGEAAEILRQAWEAQREALGPDARETLATQRLLAAAYMDAGRSDEAEPIIRDGAERCVSALGDDDPITLQARAQLGELLQSRGDYAEADPLLRGTIEQMRGVMEADDLPLLAALQSLSASLSAQGKLAEAAPICEEVLALSRKRYGQGHPAVLAAMNNMATMLMQLKRPAEAEPLCRELLETVQATLPAGHWQIAWSRYSYAACLVRLNKLAEAEGELRVAYDEAVAALGPDHYLTERIIGELVTVLDGLGDPTVLDAQRLAVEVRLRVANADQQDSVTQAVGEYLSRYRSLQPVRSAETPVRLLGETAEALIDSGDANAPTYLSNLGWALTEAGHYPEAERWLLSCHDLLTAHDDPSSGALSTVASRLQTLYERWGRGDEAERWRAVNDSD